MSTLIRESFQPWVRRLRASHARVERAAVRWAHKNRPHKVGWVTAHTLSHEGGTERLGHLGSTLDMRVSNVARWINTNDHEVWNEIYDPGQRYDVVVFVKAMDVGCQSEARRIQACGGKVVFDANVNYYEIWGEYDVPATRPTEEQRRDAIAMTALANWVVADSRYIHEIAKRHNPNASLISDNVDLTLFRFRRTHADVDPVRLVWSGVSKKAQHILMLKEVLAGLKRAELMVVSEAPPPVMAELNAVIPCRYEPYTDRAYARILSQCDIIVSPKRLINGYEMGHTEYKITLGMAAGLPAIASPQESYVDAISYMGGGILASSAEEWAAALQRLTADVALRAELGEKARRTVQGRYATPRVAAQYQELIRNLL